MTTSILSMSIALLLYTTAIWSEHILKKLSVWMIIVFTLALLADLYGTSMMSLHAQKVFSVHALFGYTALIIMLLHLLWAFASLYKERMRVHFTTYSIYAWFLWLIALGTGAALH